ncbi:MAG: DUF1598 domain-containing protein [Planctomycetes bacterium]|nr:DUF1598 domain-containing protein [Planctomycetota bacterium]
MFSKIRSPRLQQLRIAALARKHLPADINASSKLRKVSLVRLEQACQQYARDKKHVPADLQYLAGLQRIDYVFIDPDQKDIIIAGPAEGFAPDTSGRVVGVTTGRPPLRLDHLMLALRAVARGDTIGCSIDPVDKNVVALNNYLRRNSRPASAAVARSRYPVMAKILGRNTVRIWGVPDNSHFAQMMVEADIRMKRMSMGLDHPGVRGFRSYLSMLRPQGNSMQRWWFTPLYDAFYTTKDGNAFQFAGQRAQLMSQEEVGDAAGGRSDAAFTRRSTKRYAKLFTEKFPQLAEKVPVFAELQNLIDLSILAALLQKKNIPQKIGWKMSLFLDEKRATIVKGFAPKQVPSIFSYRKARRGMIIGLIGGGVEINPMKTINSIEFKIAVRGQLPETLLQAKPPQKRPEKHPWWWD